MNKLRELVSGNETFSRFVFLCIGEKVKITSFDGIQKAVKLVKEEHESKIKELLLDKPEKDENHYVVDSFCNDLLGFNDVVKFLGEIESILESVQGEKALIMAQFMMGLIAISTPNSMDVGTWIKTDDLQWLKPNKMFKFDVINVSGDDNFYLSFEEVDLSEYTLISIEEAISGYSYENIGVVAKIYGIAHVKQIIAECISENNALQNVEKIFKSTEEVFAFLQAEYSISDL